MTGGRPRTVEASGAATFQSPQHTAVDPAGRCKPVGGVYERSSTNHGRSIVHPPGSVGQAAGPGRPDEPVGTGPAGAGPPEDRGSVGDHAVAAEAASPGRRQVIAVFAEPVLAERTDPAEPCAARRRDSDRVWQPCSDPVTHEALRVCHGTTQRDTLCADHTQALVRRDATRCRTCKTESAVLLTVMPLGGVA